MLLSEIIQRLLLVGSCLCVYGNPVRPPDIELEQDGDCFGPCTSLPPNTSSVQELKAGAGGEGGERGGGREAVDPRATPGGTSWPPQTANRGSADAGTGPSWVGVDGKGKAGSKDKASATSPPSGHPASFTAAPQSSSSSSSSSAGGGSEEEESRPPEAPLQDIEPGPTIGAVAHTPSSFSPRSPVPPMVFVSIQTSTPLSLWGHDSPSTLSVQEPLLPDMGSNLMPREDGPESLWTEATRPGGMNTVTPSSQDEATEGTMSSEALPLIFDPSEDVTSEAAPAQTAAVAQPPLLLPGGTGPPAVGPPVEVDPEQLDTAEADGEGPSNAALPDWTRPETVAPLASVVPLPTERQVDQVRTAGVEEELLATIAAATSSSSSSPVQPVVTMMVRMTTHPPVHKSRSGLEEMESEEESDEDEDEDEENSEESVEDESDEDLTDTPRTSPTQPPYSLIPPPPVWVQHDQGLMRSWVELIREKITKSKVPSGCGHSKEAGYVSGMLAPVGIGIMGALLIVGVLYSIRMIHRKRRNSFKHQRRKVRQPEQPREPGMSRQDQAMLLADSSEDEF